MTKLIGSAPNLEMMKAGIVKFFCGTQVTLEGNDKEGYTVSNSSGVIEGCRVVLKGKRYRFEMES